MIKKVLTIAGSDSGGGAGIQQDLKVFSALKTHGTSVITAVTAQNTKGVQGFEVLSNAIISAQIDAVMRDIKPDAVKTGMLANSEVIRLVYKKMKQYRVKNLVVDPVMVSTSGRPLLAVDAVEDMRRLISIARLVTPNIHEAEILSGIKIKAHKDMEAAAESISKCLVKGGHLDAVDVLFYDDGFHRFGSRWRVNARIHGTGCALSAAIAANLAKGEGVVSAVGKSKEFIDEAISRNFAVGSGLRMLDAASLKLGKTYLDRERDYVIENVENAVRDFASDKNSYKLMPQVGVNIAMALKQARKIDEVAGISGRMVRDREKVVPVGIIDFGGSSHVGRIVLTAMKHDAKIRAAMNVRFGEEILAACGKLGLLVSGFERQKQPKDTKTMEWGAEEAIMRSGRVPDVIYDRGGIGKEAMIRILGNDAMEVAGTAIKIAALLK